ncbi:MAG: MlaD family protein [Alphaproteobacteria bacterium]
MQKDTYSVDETKHIKLGLYTIAILLITMIVAFAPNSNRHSLNDSQSYKVFARFNRTDGLLVGDAVRMAGVSIGKISNSVLDDNFKAILTLDIQNGIIIPDDSSASIVSSSLIGGDKYIEIEAGGMDSSLTEGSEFEYTQDAMVLEEILQRIIDIGKANRNKGKNDE